MGGASKCDGVDAVFINLDRAEERRRFMEAQGERLGLPLVRRSAVKADDIPQATIDGLNGRWERPLSRAELGCFLSHHALWTEIAAGSRPMLVLEDDVMLSRRLADILPHLVILEEVDFLNLESFDRRRFVGRAPRPVAAGISILRTYRDKSGSAAYLLWPEGAKKLLGRANHGAAPVDAFLHGLRRLVSWQVEPALAMQLHIYEARGRSVPIPAGSSVQTPRTRLSPTLEHLPFLLRRIATQFSLAGHHASRLFGRRYRVVDIVEEEFDHSRS